MSLPNLLRRVGHTVPRGVSIDGRIVTGAAARVAVAAGTATWVEPHVFHGGEDPTEPEESASGWWTDADARRRDIEAMAAAFPDFQLTEEGGMYKWEGVLDTGRGRFRIKIVDSPTKALPTVVPVQPQAFTRHEGRRFVRSPHLYLSGNLCVADRDDWDPERHTTATVVAWAAHWLAAYTDWRLSGCWPTQGFVPDAAA